MKRSSWFLGMFFLGLALLATVARGAQSLEDIKTGITKNLHANYQACNEENMSKLLKTMSKEMPNKQLFVQTTKMAWNSNDTYNRLDAVEVLPDSDAPYANCEFPYATALVTQTVIVLQTNDARNSAFKSRCANGRCKDPVELAHKMSLVTKTETTQLQMLFKYENKEWKLIAGLTDPVPVDDAPKVERENEERAEEYEDTPRVRSGKSVFN